MFGPERSSSVSVSDVGPAPEMTAIGAALESRTWPLAKGTKEVTTVDLWRPLLDAVRLLRPFDGQYTDINRPVLVTAGRDGYFFSD